MNTKIENVLHEDDVAAIMKVRLMMVCYSILLNSLSVGIWPVIC